MPIRQKRRLASWLLLSVFVPMMVLTSLHRHHVATDTAVACVDCAHHVHHSGHLTVGDTSIDNCLLCQFSGTPYVGDDAAEQAFLPSINTVSQLWRTASLPAIEVLQKSSRAPPVV